MSSGNLLEMETKMQAKKEIGNTLSKLNALFEDTTPTNTPKSFSPNMDDKAKNKAAMAQTLGKLNALMENISADSMSDPDLRRALATTKIDNGVQIASWKIIEENKKYNVLYGNTIILENLRNYVSANAVVKLLEQGNRINNPVILEIINYEDKFSSIYTEALLFKNYLKKNLSESKREIYSDQLEEAKNQLRAIKEKIGKIDSAIR